MERGAGSRGGSCVSAGSLKKKTWLGVRGQTCLPAAQKSKSGAKTKGSAAHREDSRESTSPAATATRHSSAAFAGATRGSRAAKLCHTRDVAKRRLQPLNMATPPTRHPIISWRRPGAARTINTVDGSALGHFALGSSAAAAPPGGPRRPHCGLPLCCARHDPAALGRAHTATACATIPNNSSGPTSAPCRATDHPAQTPVATRLSPFRSPPPRLSWKAKARTSPRPT